jgi:hypothetical protein
VHQMIPMMRSFVPLLRKEKLMRFSLQLHDKHQQSSYNYYTYQGQLTRYRSPSSIRMRKQLIAGLLFHLRNVGIASPRSPVVLYACKPVLLITTVVSNYAKSFLIVCGKGATVLIRRVGCHHGHWGELPV